MSVDGERAAARRERAAEQQHRAEEALRRIAEGGDPGAESLRLSNEFTDGVTSRLLRRFRRGGREPGED